MPACPQLGVKFSQMLQSYSGRLACGIVWIIHDYVLILLLPKIWWGEVRKVCGKIVMYDTSQGQHNGFNLDSRAIWEPLWIRKQGLYPF